MLATELSRALDVALGDIKNRVSFTLTAVPADKKHLLSLLEAAVRAGTRNLAPLVEIQIPGLQADFLGARYGQVPVVDSGEQDVLRFVYEPRPLRGPSQLAF